MTKFFANLMFALVVGFSPVAVAKDLDFGGYEYGDYYPTDYYEDYYDEYSYDYVEEYEFLE